MTDNDLPVMQVEFTKDIPDLDPRLAHNPTEIEYLLVADTLRELPRGMSLGETWEFENGDYAILCYARGVEPPVGAISITFVYPE